MPNSARKQITYDAYDCPPPTYQQTIPHHFPYSEKDQSNLKKANPYPKSYELC